jgi:hypothetical protein
MVVLTCRTVLGFAMTEMVRLPHLLRMAEEVILKLDQIAEAMAHRSTPRLVDMVI